MLLQEGHPVMEVEVKLKVKSREEMRERILGLGAVPAAPRVFEDNFLLDTASRDLQAAGCAVRVRIAGAKAVLTYKGKPVPEQAYKVREEIQTEIKDGQAALDILRRLGFSVTFRYQKYREKFRLGDLEIVLDETALGDFIELEGKPADIDEASRRLGYAPADYITMSYLGLYLEHCRARGIRSDAMLLEGAGR
jgi:adenylate cyclase class 2